MNDFDYDVMLKKRVARGAYHRKRGSKSRKCTLPSDHLSPAELKRRNGPMKEYKMNAPMSWAEFNDMPDDLQARYILNLRGQYGATDNMFGEMFHVHASTFALIRSALGITGKMPRADGAAKVERAEKWNAFLSGETVTAEPDAVVTETEPENTAVDSGDLTYDKPVTLDPLEAVTPVTPVEISAEPRVTEVDMTAAAEPLYTPDALRLADLSATFRGEFDPMKFMLWVSKLPMPDGKVQIRIEVTEA